MKQKMRRQACFVLIAVMILEMLLPGSNRTVYASPVEICSGTQLSEGNVSSLWFWEVFQDNLNIGTTITPESGRPLYKKEDGSVVAESSMTVKPDPEWTEEAAAAGLLKYPKAGITVRFKQDHTGVDFKTLGIKYIRVTAKSSGPMRFSILNEITDQNAAKQVENAGEGSEPGIYIDDADDYTTVLYDMTPFGYGFNGAGEDNKIDIFGWVNKDSAPEGVDILTCILGFRWEVKDTKGGIGTISIRSIEFLDANQMPVKIPADNPLGIHDQFSVTFDRNGGEGTMEKQTFTYDEEPVLNSCGYSRNGYTFTGWNTKVDGSGTVYNDGAKLNYPLLEEDENMTFYAQWKKQEPAVVIDVPDQNTDPIDKDSKQGVEVPDQKQIDTSSQTKVANPLKIKGKNASAKYKKLKKKAQSISRAKLISFTQKGKGQLTYSLSSAKKGRKSFKKYFKVNAKTGKLTIKKGLKKGTYKIHILVKAAGNDCYEASEQLSVTCKVTIK